MLIVLWYSINLNFSYAAKPAKPTKPKPITPAKPKPTKSAPTSTQLKAALKAYTTNNHSGVVSSSSKYKDLVDRGYLYFKNGKWYSRDKPSGQPQVQKPPGYKPPGGSGAGSGGVGAGSGAGSGGGVGGAGSGKPPGYKPPGGSGGGVGGAGSGAGSGVGSGGYKPPGSGRVKPPPKGGVSNMGWSDDYSEKYTKPTETHVIINTASDSAAEAAKKVAELKAKGKYVNGYLNLGRLIPEEHKDMYKEIADGLKKIGKSINSVTQKPPGDDDYSKERWITTKGMADPKVREVFTTAWKNEIQRMGKQGFDAVNLDNVDYYQSDNGGGGKEPTKAQLNQAAKMWSSIADTIHKNGMAAGWKNAPEIAPQMVAKYDFVVTEQMFQNSDNRKYGVPQFSGFVEAGKPVYNFEVKKPYYGDVPDGWASYNKGGHGGYKELDVNF